MILCIYTQQWSLSMIDIDDRELKQVINQLKYFDTNYFTQDFRQSAKKASSTILTKWKKDANAKINYPLIGGHEKRGSFTGRMRRYSIKENVISKSKYKYDKMPLQDNGDGSFSFKLKNKILLSNIFEAKRYTPHIGKTTLSTRKGFGNKERTEAMFDNYTQDFTNRLADFVKKQVERKSKV